MKATLIKMTVKLSIELICAHKKTIIIIFIEKNNDVYWEVINE